MTLRFAQCVHMCNWQDPLRDTYGMRGRLESASCRSGAPCEGAMIYPSFKISASQKVSWSQETKQPERWKLCFS
jgi:hypothetical protein